MIKNIGHTGLTTKWKIVGREKDSRERGRVLLQMSDDVSQKLEKIFMTDVKGYSENNQSHC
jgi:hypothetical protein